MRFLLRLAFWLGLVLVLLPSGGSPPTARSEVNPGNAFSAARATVADMRQFCDRQPNACTFGAQAAVAIGHRAQAGAKLLYEFLNDQFGPTEPGATAGEPSDPATTGAVTQARNAGEAAPLPAARPSQDTLTPADRVPTWRGPQPREARSDRPA